MKTLKLASAVVLVLAVFLSLGALTVLADGPTGTSPLNASYIDNQAHMIPGGSSVWYRFDYGPSDTSDRPMATISLKYGNKSGVGFEIWAQDTINDMADNHPIGRGTAYAVDCDTGNISGSGGCQSNDLMWSGNFGGVGICYVRVDNNNPNDTSALLTIQGAGVRLAPQVAPSAVTQAPNVATANTDDPNKAAVIDGQSRSVPTNSAVWYSFNYSINTDTGERPTKTITLVNGNHSGVKFEVWSPDNLNDWWDNSPVGKGTPASVSCDTGAVFGPGGCQSNDLTWSGSFGATGAYYVRVINDSSNAIPAVLTIQ